MNRHGLAAQMATLMRRAMIPTIVFLLTTIAFMPRAIVGDKVAGPFDMNTAGSPYRDRAEPVQIVNGIQSDVNEAQPWWLSFWRDARRGEFQTWSPNVAGGTPTGILPLNGSLSPFSWSALIVPFWYAVTLRVALLLFVGQVGMFLFSRQLGLSRWPSILAGVAYAFGGTSLVYLLRIGAATLLPLFLWTILRLCERITPARIAAVAGVVAWMWSEGFPAAMVYNMATGGILAVVVLATNLIRGRQRWSVRVMSLVKSSFAFATALVAGLAISAVTLLPFASELSDRGTIDLAARQYDLTSHLSNSAIWGLVHPSVTGSVFNGAGFLVVNSLEGVSFAGSLVLGAALATLMAAAIGRLRVSPATRTAWPVLVSALLGLTFLIFVGTRVLGWVYEIPGISGNLLHRSRYILDFAAVAIAAVGVDAALKARHGWWHVDSDRDPDEVGYADSDATEGGRVRWEMFGTPGRWATGLAGAGFVACFALTADNLITVLYNSHRIREVATSFAVATLIAVAGVGLVIVAARAPHRSVVRVGSMVVLTALLWAQLALPLKGYIPEVDRDFFPHVTAGHRELARITEGERYRFAGEGLTTFYSGGAMLTGGFDLRGLTLQDPGYRRLVQQADAAAFEADPFKTILHPASINWAAPALDHLALRAFVVSTNKEPIGSPTERPKVPEVWSRVERGSLGSVEVPGGIGGVELSLRGSGACRVGWVTVTARSGGQLIDESRRPLADVAAVPMWFALTGGALKAGDKVDLRVTSSVPSCELSVATSSLGTALRWAMLDDSGPIRLVSTGAGWFYERSNPWPMVSMHTAWSSFDSRRQAADAVSTWKPGDPIPVVRSEGSPGGTAKVRSFSIRGGNATASVTSTKGGLVVVSMNDSRGWHVDVDGQPATLLSTDGDLLSVAVPAGQHDVGFRYEPPYFALGATISVVTLVGLAMLIAVDLYRRRRAGRRTVGPAVDLQT